MIDLSLVLTTFLFALMVRKRKKTNKRLYKDLKNLKVRAREDYVTVGGLAKFLEECRSRNTCLEMPLRKVDRQCGGLKEEALRQSMETDNLLKNLQSFKEKWNEEANQLKGAFDQGFEQRVSEIKIVAELSMLRKFVFEELRTIRNVGGYFKSYVDEAEDDVDRLLISEGL